MTSGGYHRLVVLTEFPSCSAAASEEVQRFARVRGSELILVHAVAAPSA